MSLPIVVITVSKQFFKGHPKAGQDTDFKQKIIDKIKQHTIRLDEKGYWLKAISKVARGEAVLSIRQWSGKPYASKQEEVCVLTAEDGVDCVQVEISNPWVNIPSECLTASHELSRDIAENDGLTPGDFWAWFGTNRTRATLIYFTKMRYLHADYQKRD